MSFKRRVCRQINTDLLTGVYCVLDGTHLATWADLCSHLETVHKRVYSDWFYRSVKREVDDFITGDWSSLYSAWLNNEPYVQKGFANG